MWVIASVWGAPCGSADKDEDGRPEQIGSRKTSAADEPGESAPKCTYEISPRQELPRAPQDGTHLLQASSDRHGVWPALPGWARLPPETLLLRRSPVNWNACPAADPGWGEPLNHGPWPSSGCFGPVGRSLRMALPSALPAPWSALVRPPQGAVLAAGRCGTGLRRTGRATPPPRPAVRPRSGRGARSGRRSSRASRARS